MPNENDIRKVVDADMKKFAATWLERQAERAEPLPRDPPRIETTFSSTPQREIKHRVEEEDEPPPRLVPVSYNCVDGVCVDPMDNTGVYSTLATCQADCGECVCPDGLEDFYVVSAVGIDETQIGLIDACDWCGWTAEETAEEKTKVELTIVDDIGDGNCGWHLSIGSIETFKSWDAGNPEGDYMNTDGDMATIAAGTVAAFHPCCDCPPDGVPTHVHIFISVASVGEGDSFCGSPEVDYSFSLDLDAAIPAYSTNPFGASIGRCGADMGTTTGTVTVGDSPSECCTGLGNSDGTASIQCGIAFDCTTGHYLLYPVIHWNATLCGRFVEEAFGDLTIEGLVIDIGDSPFGEHTIDPSTGGRIVLHVVLS